MAAHERTPGNDVRVPLEAADPAAWADVPTRYQEVLLAPA